MLNQYISRPTLRIKKENKLRHQPNEISRLLSAAVINKGFRDLLLSDPARALAQGYYGEKFSLDNEQEALVLSVQAESLTDFAQQITSPRKKEPISSGAWVPVNQPSFVLHAK